MTPPKFVANNALIPPHRTLVPPHVSPPYGGGQVPPMPKSVRLTLLPVHVLISSAGWLSGLGPHTLVIIAARDAKQKATYGCL